MSQFPRFYRTARSMKLLNRWCWFTTGIPLTDEELELYANELT